MKLAIEKFPRLTFRGRRLIWDSRQEVSGVDELVVLRGEESLRAADRAALLARPRTTVIDASQTRDPDRFLGEAASEALGHPSQKMIVVAVTGTNGKTTCASLLRALLVARNKRVCEIGTLGVNVWGLGPAQQPECLMHLETGFTTPEAPTLQHLFSQLAVWGVESVVMEASSHAMALRRIAGIDFDGALFTNLTQDHLDFHRTMERYEEAKASLFKEFLPGRFESSLMPESRKKKFAVLNVRDPAGRRILSSLPLEVSAQGFELGRNFDVLKSSLDGLRISIEGREIESPLVGAFNAENIVGSLILAEAVTRSTIEMSRFALAHFSGAPGRMDRVGTGAPYVFVDYAHTPDALEKALKTLGSARDLSADKSSRIVVVFGCGGDRDKTKRPLMGKIAAQLADRVVLTSDNPRSENPLAILEEIRAGVPESLRGRVEVIEDRRMAISRALKTLSSSDVCLIAGKGHEAFQIVGAQKLPFSDSSVALDVLHSVLTQNR